MNMNEYEYVDGQRHSSFADLFVYYEKLNQEILQEKEWALDQPYGFQERELFDVCEPYRVCRRVNILRDYPDDKIKIYP